MTPLIDRISKTYDEVPYTSAAFSVSAPEHLRAVAHLFGLDTVVPARARVLELGCAAGGNLIPFAVRHPDADVVGIDLSPVQIDIGREVVEAMGLKNVRLIQGSIVDAGADLGQFDYIVCHGVYSWVPEEVRAAILRICNERLTPDGVAYVSYNTYPGWKAKEIVRDAMLLRGGERATAHERLAYARGMIEFLHEQAAQGSLLSTVMNEHIETIRDGEDFYLSHEYLELCNAPCYFKDFVAAARQHDLEYLGDATVASMFAGNYGATAAPALLAECGGDQVVLEQLMDFLQNRQFRQSLLVRADRGARIRYLLTPERIGGLHVAGQYAMEEEGEGQSRWRHVSGATVAVSGTVTRSVLERLNAAWPATVPVAELVADATEEDANRVYDLVTNLVIGNAVRFRIDPIISGANAERPYVHAALRTLAAANHHPVGLYTQWHQSVRLQPLEKFLLPLLDGSLDMDALIGVALQAVEQGGLQVTRDGQPLTDAGEVAASIRGQIETALHSLAASAMLDPMPIASAQRAEDSGAPTKRAEKDVAATPDKSGKSRSAKPDATASTKPPRAKK